MKEKLKLSLVMLKWNIGGWIDNSSPLWFRLTYWTIYHITHSDPMEKKTIEF